jgi:protein-ribulosamine 3-kinase
VIGGGAAMEIARQLGAAPAAATPQGGGCISPAWRVELSDGRTVFVKEAPRGMGGELLQAEANSLRRLGSTGALRVPEVLGLGAGWLALEWLEPQHAAPDAWADLGRGLARLHEVRGAAPGWDADNFIGSLPQRNGASRDWPGFWREHRLEPQLRRARAHFAPGTISSFHVLFDQLPDLLAAGDADGPSLLHGDLWSGNVHATRGGLAAIDPSSYYGHREVDLAMAELFGGFPPSFMESYTATWPLLPGYERRRPVYQLYYLLVHVNLFGGSYIRGTEATLRAALG